jgi:glycosyltransferase involved in cell wall biosynthesis
MNKNPLISVVSPVYGCSTNLIELYVRLKESISTITEDFEIILVNDASPDDAWNTIVALCEKDERVKGLNLSRNFGQHYAITAGLEYAKGEWVVVMDCDLQDRPEEIPNLYNKAMEGYDSVFAQRFQRKDKFFKRFFSKMFYALFGYLTETKQDPSVANFGIYSRNVIDSILQMRDQIRFFPTMVQWVGYNKFYFPVKHDERGSGISGYSLKKLINLAINNIIAFSDKPLRLTAKIGFVIASLSFIVGFVYLIMYFFGKIEVLGFASLIISLWFLSGVIMMILGMLGLYIGKVFEKVKERPVFIVKKKINL